MYNLSVIILAAGLGRRMKSEKSKVLHEIGGKPMILRTAQTVQKLNPREIIVVANKNNVAVLKKTLGNKVNFVIQQTQQGTAHATKAALPNAKSQIIAVFYGDDTAFYSTDILKGVLAKHLKSGSVITCVTLIKDNPSGLGRVIRIGGKITEIVEEKDALPSQKQIKEVTDGLFIFKKSWLIKNTKYLKKSLATGEYYLTELINTALKNREIVETYNLKEPGQWHGINTPEELQEANLKFSRRIHIMGIAGAGASAISAIAKHQGFEVSGCDLNPHSAYASNLKGIDVKKGHDPDHLHNIGRLVISSAILKKDPKNREVAYAKKHKIPILLWEQFQSLYLQAGKFVIAVAGAYGKSTTTSMISQILTDAGLDPTCEVGAKVMDWGLSYRVGKSKYYVCEVDEYLDKFLNYNPDVAVILNLGWDHPDYFKTRAQVESSYRKFTERIKPGGIVVTPNLPGLQNIKRMPIEDFGPYELSIIGDFRRENANAALTVAKLLKLNIEKAKKSVESFKGTGRRLEFKGKIGKVDIYDDYAVQPYTVLKTTNALKAKHPGRPLILIFEPHTFSRINTFFDDFVDSLKKTQADKIFITDVYPAREKGDARKLSQKLAGAIGPKAIYCGSIKKTAAVLKSRMSDQEVILSMGAGDIYKIYDLLKRQ